MIFPGIECLSILGRKIQNRDAQDITIGFITPIIMTDQENRNKDVKDFKDKYGDFLVLNILNILVASSSKRSENAAGRRVRRGRPRSALLASL
jgi:hypothetical protein